MSRYLSAALMMIAAFAAAPARAQVPDEMKIDKDRYQFTQIRDKTPFQFSHVNPGESEAYASVLLHVRQFDADALLAAARRDVTYKDLYKNTEEFRLELVAFEGRLKQLRRTEATLALKEAGIAEMYEAWVFPTGEQHPITVVFTELPPGLVPQKDLQNEPLDRWVAVAGYAFKIFQYESRERDPQNTALNKQRLAPLLLAKTLSPKADPTVRDQGERWHTTFGPAVVGGVGGLGALVVGLTWWFRRGDKAVRETIDARRDENPFTA